jgi:outer membrane immunogenic protein
MSKSKSVASGFSMLALVAAVAPASAADLPVKAPPPVVAAVYDWTGFYIGVHGGGGWGKKDGTSQDFLVGGVVVAASQATIKPSGWLAGGQIGYNFYQSPTPWWFGGRVVIGVEAQGSWADMDESVTCFSGAFTANCTAKVNSLGTVALRYGTTWDRVFLYSKLGVAWSRDEYTIVSTVPGVPASFSGDETRWGWMSGIGIELALAGNWSIKGEYNYMSLGKEQVSFSGTPAGTTFDVEIKQRIHVVKFGVNYRFGGGGAVVARY